MAENYTRVIPEAPLPVSMLPRPEELTLQDLLLLIQTASVPGQKTKAVSLSQLAAFLQLGNFSEITLNGSNGKKLVLNGNGITYTKPPTPGTLDQYTITENDSGVQIAINGPHGNRLVKVATDEISISRTLNGLESKVVISESGISVSNQTRDGAEIVTTTSTLNSGELDLAIVKLLGSAGDWLFETQTAANSDAHLNVGDLWIGRGLGSLSAHIFSKLCVWKQAYFDKDVEISGDLSITGNKTLTVSGFSQLNGVGLNYITLSNITQGGSGVWKASSHGPDYLFYNQSASNGNVWWVMNDTGNDIDVAYDYHSSSGGGITAITLAMPANSIAAFLRVGNKWWRWVG